MHIKLPRELTNFMLEMEANKDRAIKNYSSLVFENGIRWRYWEIKLKTRRIRFCYTTTANALGCYLTFIETVTATKAKREKIWAHDTRREAKAYALRQYQKAKTSQQIQAA